MAMLPYNIQNIFTNATTNATSSYIFANNFTNVVQASISGTGAVSATVTIYGSIYKQNTGGVSAAVLTLSGTNTASTGTALTNPWPYYYAVITAITGTSAKVTCDIGS